MALLFLVFARAGAQSPSLFLTAQDFQDRAQLAKRAPWAGASLKQIITEANAFPESYEKRFGLQSVELPPEGGQWLHWYVCPETGTPLQFRPPNHNVCPDTGKEYPGAPFDAVVYQLRNDALRRAALTLALAYRFTNEVRYARGAVQILTAFADKYQSWPLHDNHGKPTVNGGKAYSQTLDESIWLIDIAWTYDLVRGSGLMDAAAKAHVERDLLRASYVTVSKAHKEVTDNIQSWVNAAIAAVGFTLKDQALIREAVDGPIGFRYQMHHFVIQGFWIEGAMGYHFYALRALTATAQMAKRAGLDLWSQEPALLTLFKGPIAIVLPNGELPAFNDSGPVDLYGQDYLYEQAYAASREEDFVPVMAKYGRTSREAFLFGVERIPKAPPLHLQSQVLADAGYAALRNDENDLTVIAKFGQHGGAHGHYDKLNFILYSQGRVMGVDPGTQLYGLPLHQQWDSMTIAHNTVTVDQRRQAAATGKLIDWQMGPHWVSVTMDAGAIYQDVKFERSIYLAPQFCVVVDRLHASSPHTFDWIYHNAGTLDVSQPKLVDDLSAFPAQAGYGYLKGLKSSTATEDLHARFVDGPSVQTKESAFNNSPAATMRPAHSAANEPAVSTGQASLTMIMPAQGSQEWITGVAPGHDLKRPVPFVLDRKQGEDARFTAVFSPLREISVTQSEQGADRVLRIAGQGFSDEVVVNAALAIKPQP